MFNQAEMEALQKACANLSAQSGGRRVHEIDAQMLAFALDRAGIYSLRISGIDGTATVRTQKITFSRSEPYHQGWRGWSDVVDVFLDGRKIGVLRASDCPQRRWLEYKFGCELPGVEDRYSAGFGIRAAKEAAKKAIQESLNQSVAKAREAAKAQHIARGVDPTMAYDLEEMAARLRAAGYDSYADSCSRAAHQLGDAGRELDRELGNRD